MFLFGELSGMETCTLCFFLALIALGLAMRKAVNNVKSAASNTWSAVRNSPVAGSAAKVGFWYFLRHWLR